MGFMNVVLCFMLLRIVTFNARGLLDRKFEKVKEICKEEDVIFFFARN